MGEQVAARFMGLQLSRLERTPDKREVGGSSPLKPIGCLYSRWKCRTLKTEYIQIFLDNQEKTSEAVNREIDGNN